MIAEGQKTNLIRIPIGDEGGDGHNQFVNFDFRVPVEFTKEILAENYQKNKKELGFGLSDFASEYDDSSISCEQFEVLIAAGYDPADLVDKDDWDIRVSRNEMFKIAIFFISRGLDGFTYEIAPKPDFTLFRGRETEYTIGYALFFN